MTPDPCTGSAVSPAEAARAARRPLVYAVLGVWLFVPILTWFYWPAADGLDVQGYAIGRDFINTWVGPQLAFGGRLTTLFDFPAYNHAIGELFGHPLRYFHAWVYPLHALPLLWPLGKLPYAAALALWTLGLFAVFATVVLREVAPDKRLTAGLALACAPACLINMIGGQTGFLTGALLLGGVLAIDRRPILAGVLFGFLTLKPHLGLVLPFALVALGAWRVVASATLTFAALIALSVALFGIDPWVNYLHVTGAREVFVFERFQGFLTDMVCSVFAAGRTFHVPYQIALDIQLAVSLPVIIAACWAVRRTADPCRRAFVLAAAAPLVSPYVFNYDLPALAAVQVWMLAGRLPWRREWAVLSLVVWATPLALMYSGLLGIAIAPPILLLMFCASVREAVGGTAAGHVALADDAGRSAQAAPARPRLLGA